MTPTEVSVPVEEYLRLKTRSCALAYERELRCAQIEAALHQGQVQGYRQAIHDLKKGRRSRDETSADRAVRESNDLYEGD